MWNMSRKFKPLVMYVAEFAPIDLLVFVVVLVDDFFVIKLFHYHVQIIKKNAHREARRHLGYIPTGLIHLVPSAC